MDLRALPGPVVIYDLETDNLLDAATKVHILVMADVETGEHFAYADHGSHPPLSEGFAKLAKAGTRIGHNVIDFDERILRKLVPQFSWDNGATVVDTLVLSRLHKPDMYDEDKAAGLPQQLCGRHSLEAWGHRLGVHKATFGRDPATGGHGLGKNKVDWSTFTEEMMDYAKQDAVVSLAHFRHLQSLNLPPEAIALEHFVADLMAAQKSFGFAFDVKKAEALHCELLDARERIAKELEATFPPWWGRKGSLKQSSMVPKRDNKTRGYVAGAEFTAVELIAFNPKSRAHVADRLQKVLGWKPKDFTDKGAPKVDDEVLQALPWPEAKKLAKLFLVDKRIGQLADGNNAWLKVEKQGRIHGSVNALGAVTHRATHASPNIAQVPSVKKAKGEDGKEHPLKGAEGEWGWEARDLFSAPPGWYLVGADLAGIELRCLAHYMARWDNGAYGKLLLEDDIHTVNQKAAGLPTRAAAKTFIYAFLYGAGNAKIGSIVEPLASEEKQRIIGGKLKKRFMRGLPALGSLVEAVQERAAGGWIKGLDGRLLYIRHKHAALNTLLQSAGALVAKRWLYEIVDGLWVRGFERPKVYEFSAWVHDEVQIACREKAVAEAVQYESLQAAARAGEHYKFRCPVAADARIGRTWADTH